MEVNQIRYNQIRPVHTTNTLITACQMIDEMTQLRQVTAAQDLIAGGIAGSCSVIVGHPFDTYKVMLQTSAKSVQKRSLSISRLYRGITPPLVSAGVLNAIAFSSYGESSRLWDRYVMRDQVGSQSNK